MIPVVLGVLVALFINNGKEHFDNQRFVNKVFKSIHQEMIANQKEFDDVMERQYALIDTFKVYQDSSISILDLLGKTNGLQVPTVKNISWRSFLNSKIELINFDCLSTLTDIDESKKILQLKVERLMDHLLGEVEATDSASKRKLVIHTVNVIDSEKELARLYKKYLSECAQNKAVD